MGELGKQAIQKFPPNERDISSMTVGISESGLELLKERS